ncbi:MAG: putative bifunctional diguanylate cyclase/phosphodiesterase [Streptosporangiaceae bacterium]
MAAYAAWMTLLLVAYYALPGIRVAVWGVLALSGVAAMVAGVILNRPARRAPWLLLAAANLSFAVGQLSFLILTQVRHQAVPFPSLVDLFYLATYPLYAVGLFIFIRRRSAGHDRRSLLDALTLTVGLALLSWVFLILPYVNNAALTWLQKAVAIAYPLGDVLVLAMLARLLAPGTWRSRSLQLLTLGSVGLLASDAAFGAVQLYGSFRVGTLTDLGWAVFYAAWGAAALHPSMTELTQPAAGQRAPSSVVRLTLIMLASLIAPAVLLAEAVAHRVQDAGVIAVCSALLYILVLSRLADVAAALRQTLARAQVLRLAGAALAAAATVEEAASAVRSGVASLMRGRQPGSAVLAVREGSTLRLVGAPPDEPPVPAELPAGQAERWLSLLNGPEPQLLAGAEGDQSSVLLIPLSLQDRPSGDPLIGVIAVSGASRDLAALAGTFEVLARQTALVVERVVLSHEVIRRDSEAYFRTLVHDTSDVILIVDDYGRIRYATPSARSIFGDIPVDGEYLWDLVQPDEREEIARALAEMRSGAGGHGGDVDEDWRITARDGSYVEVEVRCSDLRHEPTVGGLVLTLRDVTEQRQLERELKYRAFHDSLTGLPNRVLFQERVVRALARSRRTDGIVGVLFIDLDDFKVTNDTMGHSVGDELLVAAGRRLSALTTGRGTAARLGGDEFGLLIEDAPDGAAVENLAEAIVLAFQEPFTLVIGSAIVTATVGVATSEDATSTSDLVRSADLALYAANSAGNRQWRRYQPVLSAGMMRRHDLQAALDSAVTESAFTLVYQPIAELNTGAVAGFEALLRWPHAEWGMVQPDQFIALAEETGHIVPLGAWVLQQATTDLARWQQHAPDHPPVYVSVNVAARQLRDPGFVGGVRRRLTESGLPPSSLVLELTESGLLRPDQRLQADLEELKSMGVRLAIDDFGTGYSSLSYLRELPIDVLKIDKSFVDGIAVSTQRLALAEVIIRIAKTLGLTVIAEGIESEVQRDMLVSMGCRYGQGYLLATPMPADDAEALLRVGHGLVPQLPGSRLGPGGRLADRVPEPVQEPVPRRVRAVHRRQGEAGQGADLPRRTVAVTTQQPAVDPAPR